MLAAAARIAVVAPSGVVDLPRIEAGMAVLRGWGFAPELLPHAGNRLRYLAGTDEERLADLREAFSGRWDAVWMARGGYGLARIAAALLSGPLARVPLIGFSDGTALLNGLADLGVPTVHAPVINSLAGWADEDSLAALRRVLAGATPRLTGRALIRGAAEGKLRGGNLCVLASLAGTALQLDARGAVVLLEDLGETPYKLDRLLHQLVASGSLAGAAGIVLGTFLDAAPPEGADWTLDDVFLDLLGPLRVPILAGLPVGHGRRNHALPFGTARIEADSLVVG